MKKILLILLLIASGVVLYGQKIEDLTRATTATKTDLLIIDQSDATKGIAIQHLFSGDSLFLPDLATSETKVLSPTSTGGIKSIDVSEITWDTLTANVFESNGTYNGYQSDGTTSLYYHEDNISAFEVSPGGSGAELIATTVSTLGGYSLNVNTEKLYYTTHIEDDWDGATDIILTVYWEVNEASSADGTVDLQLICYYKGNHEVSTKTQTLEVAHTITDNKAQYTQHETIFTINWDETSNVVEVNDIMSLILNLETDTSECDDIIINYADWVYSTTKPARETN